MSEFLQFGIDLGTTNSCIARIQGIETVVLQNNDQMNVTPSAVRVLKTGSIIVGRRASNALVSDSENIFTEFKRLMGQRYTKTFPSSGRSFTPEELSAELIKSMLADAKRLTGNDVRSAVITVPAAFTTLQCESTAQAARLSGLEEFPLLQEPLAAAIAYGVNPGKQGKLWLIFDLGGGTLDVAVISAEDGRLKVLEHRGDNHLGGKDIDRVIVDEILLPRLRSEFELPESALHKDEFTKLYRKLTAIAEYSKIELSTSESVNVAIFEIGNDLSGNPIETELVLKRAEVDALAQPLYDRCFNLVGQALQEARVQADSLDRVLLVGGPTQSIRLREFLQERIGVPIDCSLDPMTVVARGAALYAATLESKISGPGKNEPRKTESEAVAVRLAYDPTSRASHAIIAGKVSGGAQLVKEVKLETADGLWTSGWFLLEDGLFEINVPLQENAANVLQIWFRTENGREITGDPAQLVIRQGLMTISAPPLPHTVTIEIIAPDGASQLKPIFERMSLLPIEKDVVFRSSRTLRPSEPDTFLAIKLWEGEALTDPQANHWIGNMKIRSEAINRPIPEGAEIHLHLKIDTSRLITVEAFIPHLNQHFTDKIYLPKEGEIDYLEQFRRLQSEQDKSLQRLAKLEEFLLLHASRIAADDDEFPTVILTETDSDPFDAWNTGAGISPQIEIDELRREIENLDLDIYKAEMAGVVNDDLARGLVDRSRELRARISDLEKRYDYLKQNQRFTEILREAQQIMEDITGSGTSAHQDKALILYQELKLTINRNDKRTAEKQLRMLRGIRVQSWQSQDSFWEDWLHHYAEMNAMFSDDSEAQRQITEGQNALENKDMPKLKSAVRQLWKLEIKTDDDDSEPENRETLPSGLKN